MSARHSRSRLLQVILAAGILSTAIHYTHNFIAISRYPGPASLYTPVRVLIVITWPLLTAIGVIGYRRYRDGRLREARVALVLYSLTGLSTLGHFAYGVPKIPAFFFATIFTDGITGAAALLFALLAIAPNRESALLPASHRVAS